MTTGPKAKKFRIRRAEPSQTSAEPAAQVDRTSAPEAQDTDVAPPEQKAATTTSLDDIKKEGLTGRQLRMARRVANKNGIIHTSDFDAVKQLREKGIDPFQRTNTLELVVPGGAKSQGQTQAKPAGKIQLPQTVPKPGEQVPSTDLAPSEGRAAEIRKIQLDITKRRRRKLALLVARLSVFVVLPTLFAAYYYIVMATPMFATKSEFLIQQADPPSGAGGVGGLLGSTPMATAQDSIAVQGYLESREAMLRLDADVGFRAHFSSPEIDALQRLDESATNEEAYKTYRRNVKIGYDPTEGIVRMEVIAANPGIATEFAQALVQYAEEQIDAVSLRVREDTMAGARASYEDAERARAEALNRVIALQEDLGVLDPAAANALLQTEMNTLQTLLLEKELQLSTLQDNARPNAARVSATQAEIRRIEAKIAEVQAQMTSTGSSSNNQARKNAELRLAEEDYQTRTALLQAALQAMETARIEAERQVRYLSLSVSPVSPDAPSYPRKFENTILAFLIFAGIYLMVSLTASILREQVST